MGFDPRSTSGEEFQFNNLGWRNLITFAEAHGFRWPINAEGDEHEVLDATEAAAIAAAIELGLGHGSDVDTAAKVSEELTKLLVTPSVSPLFPTNPIRFDARGVEHWRQFVRFARGGGFSIQF